MNEMLEEWIIRVAGKDYGPVDLVTLREWKDDGRVLPGNEARDADADVWVTAREIPGLFEAEAASPPPEELKAPEPSGFIQICFETLRVYLTGWFQFLGLTLLVIVPSICAQLTGAFLDESQTVDLDVRSLLAAGFAFCMLLLGIAAWPIYLAGIQILTAELTARRRLGFFALLNHAIKLWPRVAICCILVYGLFLLWAAVPLFFVYTIAVGGPSFLSSFLVLLVGGVQVWVVGRLFVNYLFWQQCAALENSNVGHATWLAVLTRTLRESKRLARSGGDLVWFKRPLWRGVLVSSLWFAFVLAVTIPTEWPAMREYFHIISTAQDPQALAQTLSALPKPHGFDAMSFALGLIKWVLRPLLGIAFVLIYFDARARLPDEEGADTGKS